MTAIPMATDSRAEGTKLARGSISGDPARRAFVLQGVQPALLGLMDGAVSTLAPIFAAAGLTGRPLSAFFVGLAASLGAAVSMGLSEALSDDGSVTGRGGPIRRGTITGVATGIGGMLHTFPFLIPDLGIALKVAYAVVVCGAAGDRLHSVPLHGRKAREDDRPGHHRRRHRLCCRLLVGTGRCGLRLQGTNRAKERSP